MNAVSKNKSILDDSFSATNTLVVGSENEGRMRTAVLPGLPFVEHLLCVRHCGVLYVNNHFYSLN